MNVKRLFWVIIIGGFAELANKLTPLLLIRLAHNRLGMESLGQAQFGISIIEVLTAFIILGYPIRGIIQIAKLAQDNNSQELGEYLGSHIILRFINFILVSLTALVYFEINPDSSVYLPIILFLLPSLFLTIFDCSYFFIATQRLANLGFIQIIIRVLSLISVFIWVQAPEDAGLFAFFTYGLNGLVTIYGFILCTRKYKIFWPTKVQVRKEFVQALPYGAFLIFLTLSLRYDIFIIEALFSAEEVGRYSGISRVQLSLIPLIAYLVNAFFSELLALKEIEQEKRFVKHTLNVILIPVSALASLIWTIDEFLLTLIIGSEFALLATPFSILIVSMFFLTLQNIVTHNVFLRHHLIHQLNFIWLLQFALGGLLSYVLAFEFGLLGVALGVLIARGITGVLSLYLADRFYQDSSLLKESLKFTIITSSTTVVAYLLKQYMGWPSVFLAAAFHLTLLLIFLREYLRNFWTKLVEKNLKKMS